ncbi:hypothetical protein [Mesorhizobium sp. BR1-1-14]|uniref:hypothetical protein n=1 Tax=Mesorhizobium sp. BR1-1-14 TaxID=2876655 RepID=UPI001CD156D5|nr:hypothetical protein [Mesorhizobium sp. BR1-1-14]MBZ9959328.1 hypothetical protein [Mesorhizobium sp. BR1-1-14]
MERLKSLRCTIPASICLLAMAVAVALAGSKISIKNADDYGFAYGGEYGFAGQQSLIVTTTPDQVFSFDVASRVGGVILQAIAQPDPSSARVNISYDLALQDGHRFTITMGDETSEIPAPDWEVIPLIRFVDSGQTAAMSLLGEPKNDMEKMSWSLFGTMFIEIHPVLCDTVLGNNFIFTDAMLVAGSPGRIRDVTESFSVPIPGYTDLAKFDKEKSEQTAKKVKDKLSTGGWNTYIYTDVGVNFKFSIRKQSLEITGEPYYAFLSLDFEKKTSDLNNELTNIFRNTIMVRDLNPKIYELDRKAFQTAAILRYIKAANTETWSALVKTVSAQSPEPSMDTPRAWTR